MIQTKERKERADEKQTKPVSETVGSNDADACDGVQYTDYGKGRIRRFQ